MRIYDGGQVLRAACLLMTKVLNNDIIDSSKKNFHHLYERNFLRQEVIRPAETLLIMIQ